MTFLETKSLGRAKFPTMFFIGVTTAQSAIQSVFPRWAKQLNLGECRLEGIDLPLNAERHCYRDVVNLIRHEPTALGALVTSHKVGLFAACRDQFDEVDSAAESLGEVCSIYKRGGRLFGRATDPLAVACALGSILEDSRIDSDAEVLVLGAGGAGTAFAHHVSAHCRLFKRIHVADRSPVALARLQDLHSGWEGAQPLSFHYVPSPQDADVLVRSLPARSIVINASGLGKDLPGSPVTEDAIFPVGGVAWDFNYRGELQFLALARRQQTSRLLRVEDGWTYFLHGWRCVIADVFNTDIPSSGPLFESLAQLGKIVR